MVTAVKETGILYDVTRDGKLEYGEVILIHEDGRRTRTTEKSLSKRAKQDEVLKLSERIRREHGKQSGRNDLQRGGTSGPTEYRPADPRHAKAGKRIPLCKAILKTKMLSGRASQGMDGAKSAKQTMLDLVTANEGKF